MIPDRTHASRPLTMVLNVCIPCFYSACFLPLVAVYCSSISATCTAADTALISNAANTLCTGGVCMGIQCCQGTCILQFPLFLYFAYIYVLCFPSLSIRGNASDWRSTELVLLCWTRAENRSCVLSSVLCAWFDKRFSLGLN